MGQQRFSGSVLLEKAFLVLNGAKDGDVSNLRTESLPEGRGRCDWSARRFTNQVADSTLWEKQYKRVAGRHSESNACRLVVVIVVENVLGGDGNVTETNCIPAGLSARTLN